MPWTVVVQARPPRCAPPGDVVLLAPAAASMDMFADYGARGDAFAAAVTATRPPEGPRHREQHHRTASGVHDGGTEPGWRGACRSASGSTPR